MSYGFGFDAGFGLFSILFVVVFILVLGTFIVTIIRGIGQWNRNNHSPRLTVDASVVAKRIEVAHHNHANATGAHGYHTSTSTWNYVTF